jgi:hypothetical protein
MTRADIIELATVNTERKYEKVGNAQLAFAYVLQDFCGRNRFWWRQLYTTFQTVAGTQTYDLTSVTLSPALPEIAIEEITQIGLVSIGQNPPIGYLSPIFDPETIIEMKQGVNINGLNVPAPPSRFAMDFNDYKTLLLDAPDGIYTLAVTGWAMPNPAKDSTNAAVPVVPPWHHKAIVDGMEAYIWSKIYGPQNDKYVTANAKYEASIALAQARPRFSTNYAQQLIQSEDAVRSTS